MLYYPPAYAPLSASALLHATSAWNATADARDSLREHLLAHYQARQAYLYASGTQALTSAIRNAFGAVRRDRVVALPAYSCFDVASAAAGAEARIIFYDIDPGTLSPDWASFEQAVAHGAGAAIIAPLYGFPVDWQCAERISRKYGTTLIEDAAQGMGGAWEGSPIGGLGPISVLSFGRGKGWTGGGGGAMLVRDDRPVDHGTNGKSSGSDIVIAVKAAGQWLLSDPRLFALPASIPLLQIGRTVYKEPAEPRAMAAYSAALISLTADAARHECEIRIRNADVIQQTLATIAGVHLITPVADGRAGYLRYPVRIPSGATRARVLAAFRRQGLTPGYPAVLPDLKQISDRIVRRDTYPGSHVLVRELITLATHSRSNRATAAQLVSMLENEVRT